MSDIKFTNMKFENFQKDKLTIEISEKSDHINFNCIGYCDLENANEVLSPYFGNIVDKIKKDKVIVDFKELKNINSASISVFLIFFQLLEKKNVHITVKYNEDVWWQSSMFSEGSVLDFIKNISFIK